MPAMPAVFRGGGNTRPPKETISFGLHGGPEDVSKFARTVASWHYLLGKFGLQSTDNVRSFLIGIRGKMPPVTGGTLGTARLLMGAGMNSSQFRVVMNPDGLLSVNARGVSSARVANIVGALPMGEGLAPVEHTFWIYAETPNAGGVARFRMDNNPLLSQAFSGSWAADADALTLTKLIGSLSLFGQSIDSTTPAALAATASNFAASDLYFAFGTDGPAGRPLPAIDLTAPQFGPAFDWGDNGQLVTSARADYPSVPGSLGAPEFYYRPTMTQAESGVFTNFGVMRMQSALFIESETPPLWFPAP